MIVANTISKAREQERQLKATTKRLERARRRAARRAGATPNDAIAPILSPWERQQSTFEVEAVR